MSSTSVFTSSESQSRWRDHMEHNYISIQRIRPCVFQVPDNLRETKPEAYTPQLVGLGPYHHFRAELQHMEIRKRAAVLDYLKIVNINYFDDDIIPGDVKSKIEPFANAVKKGPEDFEPKIRSSYDRYLDLDKETLAWVVIVDGIFLLHFVFTYLKSDMPKEKKEKIYSNIEALVADVLMLENQIPIVLIAETRKFLQQTFKVASDEELIDKFQRFCIEQSPLQLNTHARFISNAFDENNHMLHFLYQMIVKTKRTPEDCQEMIVKTEHRGADCDQEGTSQDNGDHHDDQRGNVDEESENSRKNPEENRSALGSLAREVASLGGEILEQAMEEFNSALSDAKSAGIKVSGNIEKISNILRNLQKTFLHNHKIDSLGDHIDFPSASRLNAILKITFKPLPDCCGIGNIFLYKKKILYLPSITLRATSEVILRNLVAYEATSKMGSTDMRDYVDLMCGLVKSVKDVKLLKDAQIIRGKFPPEEIVRMCNGIKNSMCNGIKKSDEKPDKNSMCNGIKKSDEKPDEKFNVQSTVKKVNDQFNKAGIVKACRSTTKCFAGCVKSFKTIFSILVLLFLAFQSFCEMYDCRRSSHGGLSLPTLHSGELDSEARLMLPRKVYRY